MKFNCGMSKEAKEKLWDEKIIKECEWHDEFAIFPVRVGEGDCRWLEVVEARRIPVYRALSKTEIHPRLTKWSDNWEYRAKEEK